MHVSELRIEGQKAVDRQMRLGHYALEAADEIDRLRSALEEIISLERHGNLNEDAVIIARATLAQ